MNRGRTGLRARVMIALAVAAIVPAVLTGALAVRRAQLDVEQEVARGHLALVRALGAGLDATLQDAQRALALVGAAWAEAPDAPADSTRRLLTRLRRELPLLRRVAVLDPDGRRLAGDEITLVSFEGRGSYGGFVSDAIFEAERPLVLVAAQARARTGELVGYLAAEIDLGFVGQMLRSARLPDGATLFVVDGEGRLIASSDSRAMIGTEPLRDSHPAVGLALAAADDGTVEQGGVLAAYRNLSSFQTTRGVSWALILEQPTDAAYALANETRRDTLLLGGLVLLLALAVGWASAGALVRPLRRLTARVDAMAAKESAEPAAPPDPALAAAPGEIGTLARRFEEMSRRLEEREKLRAALARGERLASVGALAAGVAHEVNNPLTTILGYANLLLEDRPEGHPDREALLLVADEARRVQMIVRRLLDYSRAESESGGRHPTDLNALVRRAAALVEPTMKTHRHELQLALAEELPAPSVDGRRLEQVLVNLLQNAAHAMERAGRVTLSTGREADGGGSAACVWAEVADEGPGIPAEMLDRIFEPFFTTKGPGVGTGLGLAVSQQIVLDHGGRIEVKSRLGSGSTFRVILPIEGPA